MAKSSIEWTDDVWNFLRGCSLESPGCTNCYAMGQAHRFSGEGNTYAGLTKLTKHGPVWTGEVRFIDEKLLEPMRWRHRARRIFVNSMSDFFHPDIADAQIDRAFGVMLACHTLEGFPAHQFQILTKRAARMAEYFAVPPIDLVRRWAKANDGVIHVFDGDVWFSEYIESLTAHRWRDGGTADPAFPRKPFGYLEKIFPLPNVWLCVSVENQKYADERLPYLMQTPAAVRGVSIEPQLGPVDLSAWLIDRRDITDPDLDAPDSAMLDGMERVGHTWIRRARLGWVIVGGESGHGARPFSIEWARAIVKQCQGAKVPVFVKQLGAKPSDITGAPVAIRSSKGGDLLDLPRDLRIREYPAPSQVRV